MRAPSLRLTGLFLSGLLVIACSERQAPSPASTKTAAAAATAIPTATASAPAPSAPSAPAEPEPEPTPEGMVRIPAGTFMMGATAFRGNPEERPMHEAAVPSFFLDEDEVTLAEYRQCVEAGACEPTHRDHRFCNAKLDDRDDHPVNCVDLNMAKAHCEWAGKRLPTERQWEYAASGGERRRFSWGAEDPTPKRCCYDHPGGSCPVKSFEPGAFGLHDMTGNVWEWTESAFDPFPSGPGPDALDPKKRYVYRGGSWSRRFPKWMTTRLRNRYEPDKYSASIGMRCAKTIEPVACPDQWEAENGGCVRVKGTPSCEDGFAWDGRACMPEAGGPVAHLVGKWPPAENPARLNLVLGSSPARGGAGAPEGDGGEDAAPTITKNRTPQHDDDCKRHWPNTPASYLFKGGHNYPSRKPAVAGAGCVPRDMGWDWTSACCPG